MSHAAVAATGSHPMPDSRATSATMTVHLVFLARLREAFGSTGELLSVPGDVSSVADITATLRERGGAFAAELAPGRAVRVAVNHAMVAADAPVRDGDEVALFPPVTGG